MAWLYDEQKFQLGNPRKYLHSQYWTDFADLSLDLGVSDNSQRGWDDLALALGEQLPKHLCRCDLLVPALFCRASRVLAFVVVDQT
jgi:hypothetical protein